MRFLLKLVDQVNDVIRPHVLGVRLSPFGQYGGIHDSQPLALFTFVVKALNQRGITCLRLIEGRGSEIGLSDDLHPDNLNNAQLFRSIFGGVLISAGAYTSQTAAKALDQGHADAIAFGRSFIANSDLVARIRDGSPLNAFDRSTFYGGGEHGYTDYPILDEADVISGVSV